MGPLMDYDPNLLREASDQNYNWSPKVTNDNMLTVVTALFDGRNTSVPHSVGFYNPEWVDKLYRGIKRNYTKDFDFICLTDQNYSFREDVRPVRFSRSIDQYGWMSLMEMYRPDLCAGRRFTMGLDTILTGPLDDILEYECRFALCQDPFSPKMVCNAVTLASPEFAEEFWNYWLENEDEIMTLDLLFHAPSEMMLMRRLYNDMPRLDIIFKGRILSYKAHIVPKRERITDTSIIYFHGQLKPHELDELWIRENWR